MITRIKLGYFKRFLTEEFLLEDTIVLAGPNNSGKSTLLQAVSAWNLGLQRWMSERGAGGSKAVSRTGVLLSRKDFTAIPLREMNLLWTDRSTAYGREEKPGVKPGEHKLIDITLYGVDPDAKEWDLTLTFRYASREQIYAKLTDQTGAPVSEVPEPARNLQIVHVPPFSGIGAEEARYDRGYQNLLIGQGKPGDILRNLLLEVYSAGRDEWTLLKSDVKTVFGYELLDPQYTPADPFIRIEYNDPQAHGRKPFDLASAGSGFHQVLTLLGFFYARPASVLLVDEPDAHQHVILQRQVFDRLRAVARQRQCQLLVSTHSEVILEDTDPRRILSFYARPHRLEVDAERDQVREALRNLTALDLLEAEAGANILYVEDESDLKILRELAVVLDHPARAFLEKPFFHAIHGRQPRDARRHFFALRAVRPGIRSVLVLDGDNRDLPEHEVRHDGLTVLRWKRYEIENYLLHPDSLLRFVAGPVPDLFSQARRARGEDFLRNEMPPAALSDPLGDHDYLLSVPASKTLLPRFLTEAETHVPKKDYYQIAAQMQREEIHREVTEKLDVIADMLGTPAGDEERWLPTGGV